MIIPQIADEPMRRRRHRDSSYVRTDGIRSLQSDGTFDADRQPRKAVGEKGGADEQKVIRVNGVR